MKKILCFFIIFFFMPSLCFAQKATQAGTNQTAGEEVSVTTQPGAGSMVEPVQQELAGMENVEPAATQTNKISLDLKGMDIVDVLKMIASRAKINIIVGKNVRGQVSLFIRDVDIWDAFEIILLANDLAYDKKGDLINVMTQEDYAKVYGTSYKDKKEIEIVRLKYAKAKDVLATLSQIKSEVGKVILDEASNCLILMDIPERVMKMKEVVRSTDFPLETRIFSLNYASPERISEKLKNMVTQASSSIKIDERTGKLAITDTPENLKEIEKVITAFDEKPQQVLIDAQIIELKPSDKLEMGVDWDYWINKYFRVSAPFAGVTGSTKLSIGTVNATASEQGRYKGVLDALRTLGDTKILSSPRIMVVEGQEARILVGSKEAYLTSSTTQVGESASTSETVNFVDVGIKLFVTPEISREGFITMKIRPEVSSSSYINFGTTSAPKNIPIVTTSEAETTVVVNDGTTIIIGGLRKDEKTETVKKVPVLGDIPLLSLFAKSVSREVKTSDLVILLTPHLVSGKNMLTEFSQIKPNEGMEVKMIKGEIVKEKIGPEEQK